MFVTCAGLYVWVYQAHSHAHDIRITHIEPALSRIPLDDKSNRSNSVRKPYDIRLALVISSPAHYIHM